MHGTHNNRRRTLSNGPRRGRVAPVAPLPSEAFACRSSCSIRSARARSRASARTSSTGVIPLSSPGAEAIVTRTSPVVAALRAGTLASGHELARRRLGVAGFAEVGRRVADLFARLAFAAPGLRSRPLGRGDPRPGAAPVVSVDALIAQSDMRSLHLPLTAGMRGLIGARELALMPRAASSSTPRAPTSTTRWRLPRRSRAAVRRRRRATSSSRSGHSSIIRCCACRTSSPGRIWEAHRGDARPRRVARRRADAGGACRQAARACFFDVHPQLPAVRTLCPGCKLAC